MTSMNNWQLYSTFRCNKRISRLKFRIIFDGFSSVPFGLLNRHSNDSVYFQFFFQPTEFHRHDYLAKTNDLCKLQPLMISFASCIDSDVKPETKLQLFYLNGKLKSAVFYFNGRRPFFTDDSLLRGRDVVVCRKFYLWHRNHFNRDSYKATKRSFYDETM